MCQMAFRKKLAVSAWNTKMTGMLGFLKMQNA